MTFKISNRLIGCTEPPYFVAEISANHNGSIELAKQTIMSAYLNGADAVKLQTYTPDTMTIDSNESDFLIDTGPWAGCKLYDLYKKGHTPYEWHEELFDYAKKIGITIFSSPFDETAVELLESLDCPAYKIASFELTDLPLIRRVAATKKPILISTGMASEQEIVDALGVARSYGSSEILLFHCTSSYPAPVDQANLRKIANLKNKFDVEVGLSDHTLGGVAAIMSVALGAVAIEKHFITDRNLGGLDSHFSINPPELKQLIGDVNDAWKSLGVGNFERPRSEDNSRQFRRSIYFIKDLRAGDVVTDKVIRRIRPGYGLEPKFFDEIIGKRVKYDVKRGQRAAWNLFEDEV